MIFPPMPNPYILPARFPLSFHGSQKMIVRNDFLSDDKNKI